MGKLKLSKILVDAYAKENLDISYALSELVGYVDYDKSTQMSRLPITQKNVVEVCISDDVYEELQDKFDNLEQYDETAEILLWSCYFTGGRL